MDIVRTKKWGGKREGAGRPTSGRKKQICIYVDADVLEELNQHENKTKFINDCIRSHIQKIKNDGRGGGGEQHSPYFTLYST